MSYLIKKELKFDAAHRLIHYDGKCKDLHGHTYKVVVELVCTSLDKRSIAADFGDLKKLFQGWLDDNWDHNVILNADDPLCRFLAEDPKLRTPYMFVGNPTAELMADHLIKKFMDIIYQDYTLENVGIKSIEIFETATSSCKVEI